MSKIELTLMSDVAFDKWCREHRKEDEHGVCQTEEMCYQCYRKAQLELDQSKLRGI